MIYIIISVVFGILIGFYMPINISTNYSVYITVLVLAILNYLVSSIKSQKQSNIDVRLELIVFLSEMSFALLLTVLGEQLGIPLYYAPIFYFGVNIFENLKKIIIYFLKR